MTEETKVQEEEIPQFLVVDEGRSDDLVKNGDWRTFAPGIKARLLPLTREKSRTLRREAQKLTRKNYPKLKGPAFMAKVEEENDRLIKEHVFAEWEGVVDKKRKPIPCDSAGIALLDKVYPSFINWGIAESDEIAESAIAFERQAQGNSGTSPGGGRRSAASA